MQCPNSKSSTTHGWCFSTACLSSPLTSRELEICTLEHASCCSRSFPAWVGSEKQFFGPCYATWRRLSSTSWCPTDGKMWLCFNIPLFVWQADAVVWLPICHALCSVTAMLDQTATINIQGTNLYLMLLLMMMIMLLLLLLMIMRDNRPWMKYITGSGFGFLKVTVYPISYEIF